jgi:outer membrane protein OmpA-like peptidoglycan-associated protein
MAEPTIIPFAAWRDQDVPVAGEPPLLPPKNPPFTDAPGPPAPTTNSPAVLGTTHSVNDGSVAASHQEAVGQRTTKVAPTISGNEFNLLRRELIPLACWRADDMRFEFESSFVRPELALDIGALQDLIDRHTRTGNPGQRTDKPPLSIFGHADPTGTDEFNKALSGRRAQAIYALLTRRVDLWEDLFAKPLGNDRWQPKAIQKIQATLGMTITENTSAADRRSLYKAYMDFICTARDDNGDTITDTAGRPVRVIIDAADFLAGGADSSGKGDYQGCGEFNPILMFSQAEAQKFADPALKDQRDRENAPNRRVVVFLFRPRARVIADLWPCPRAKEGSSGCIRRFWSDASVRRTFQDQRREYKDTQDTFACRFYQRLSMDSPCERTRETLTIRLYDPLGRAIPGAPFSVQIGKRKPTPVSTADERGILVVQDLEVPNQCLIRWGFPPKQGEKPQLIFFLEMFLTPENGGAQDEAKQKLNNLGYLAENDSVTNVSAFQRDYGSLAEPPLVADGVLDDQTMKLLRAVYKQCATDLRTTSPSNQ